MARSGRRRGKKIDINPTAFRQTANGEELEDYLMFQARRLMGAAERIYESSERVPGHRSDEDRPYYDQAFDVARGDDKNGLPSIQVVNTSKTAQWVEHGAHPRGSETLVLKYRVFARALDEVNLGD